MSVSVFVPSYNHEKYIERTLRSVFGQTLYPDKLLVIDDGSKDGSATVIERLLADCPFPAEFIARENRGLCATLNEGLSKTNGDYFAYLGSDDIWYPEFLDERVRSLERESGAVLAYGHADVIDDGGEIVDNTATWNIYRAGNHREILLEGNAPISSTVVYRRTALEKFGWNPGAKLEDYELYLQLLTAGDFLFDERTFSAWRKHAANTSRDHLFMLEEVLAAQERIGPGLGLSHKELQNARSGAVFKYIEILARSGERSYALKMFLKNLFRIPSAGKLFRVFSVLIVPETLMTYRKRSQIKKINDTKKPGREF